MNKTAYIYASTYRKPSDPNSSGQHVHSCYTVNTEYKHAPLWWHEKGLSFTASGYGSRIPTPYMVKFNNRWRRVYCRIYSNNGTLYIGRLSEFGERFIVEIGD
jgi:hypothetical protein